MRGGALPAALIFAAIGFALAFTPRRMRLPAVFVAVLGAFVTLEIAFDVAHAEAIYIACWTSIIVAAASVHFTGHRPGWAVLALVTTCGAAAGSVIALTGTLPDLAVAVPAVLVIFPASWLVSRGNGIAVKVVSSWLIAIAILAAALPLTPTPGYAPDHME